MSISLEQAAKITKIIENDESLSGKVKISSRPFALQRPSNDDVTDLARINVASTETPIVLSPAISQQRSERKIMTSSYPARNKWRIIAACLWSICGGFSDAAPGAILPYIRSHYHINYAVVSLIWILNAAGFILVAMLSHKIQHWLGKQKSMLVGCLLSVIMYAIVSSGGPFPLVASGFFFGGMGLAIVLAQANVFLLKLDKNSTYLALFHGSYGIGATVSPLVATAMVEAGIKWNYVYFIMLGLMLCNAVNTFLAFKGADEDLRPWDHDEDQDRLLSHSGTQTPLASDGVALQDLGAHLTANLADDHHKEGGEMRLALHNRITWLISIFVLCYQGSEVLLGGWIVSFLFDYRDAATSYGYVLSGFWGGLTLGRLTLTRPLHRYVGARRSILVLAVGTIVMIILTWSVESSLASGVFVSIAGTMIGPTYPLMITVVSGMLPRKIQVVSLTIMTAFGSSGGAIFPFVTGLIAQAAGTYVVLPIFIASYTVMAITWIALPNVERKGELPESRLGRILYRLW